MKFLKNTLLCIVLLTSFYSSLSTASNIDSTIQTRYFSIHFNSKSIHLAQYLAQHADEQYLEVQKEIPASNLSHFNLILEDTPGYHNASAQIFMAPTIRMHTYPFSDKELISNDSMWLNTLKHELSHAISTRMAQNEVEFLHLFGYILNPNSFMPRGFQEGIAQVIESNLDNKTGRAFGSNTYYEQLWIEQYKNGFISYSDFAQIHSSIDAQNAYLYGAYFFSFIQKEFGDEAIKQWLIKRSEKITWDIINTNSSWKTVFDQDLKQTWKEFLTYESKRIINNLSKQNINFSLNEKVIKFENKTNFARLKQEQSYGIFKNDKNWLFAIKTTPKSSPAKVEIYQNKNISTESTLLQTINLNVNQIDFLDENNIVVSHYQKCMQDSQLSLSIININTKKETKLSSCEKGYKFKTNNQSISWLHANHTNSEIKLFKPNSNSPISIATFEFPVQISDFAFNNKNQSLILQLKPNNESAFNLFHYDIHNKQITQLTHDNKIRRYINFISENEISYTIDENSLISPYKLDLTTNQQYKLTNIHESTFNPILIEDTIFYTVLNQHFLNLKHEKVEFDSNPQTLESLDFIPTPYKPTQFPTHKYKMIDSFKFQAVIPSYAYSTDNKHDIAVNLIANDAAQNHSLSVGLLQNLNTSLLNASINYSYKNNFSWESNINFDGIFHSNYKTWFAHTFDTKKWDIRSKIQYTNNYLIIPQQHLGFATGLSHTQTCLYSSTPCKGTSFSFAVENKNGFNDYTTATSFYSQANSYHSLGKQLRIQNKLSFIASDQKAYLSNAPHPSFYSTMVPKSLNLKGYTDLDSTDYAGVLQNKISSTKIISKYFSTYAIGLEKIEYGAILQTGTSDFSTYKPTIGIEIKSIFSAFWLGELSVNYGYFQGLDNDGTRDFVFSFNIN